MSSVNGVNSLWAKECDEEGQVSNCWVDALIPPKQCHICELAKTCQIFKPICTSRIEHYKVCWSERNYIRGKLII